MSRTFYGVLGVGPDADEEAIRAAYRERVKEHHPDVSADPDATTRFKRVTAAKETLLDAAERARYDRLGHDDYVETHADSSLWAAAAEPDAAQTSPNGSQSTADRDRRRRASRTGSATGSASDGSSRRESTSGSSHRESTNTWAGREGPDERRDRSGRSSASRDRGARSGDPEATHRGTTDRSTGSESGSGSVGGAANTTPSGDSGRSSGDEADERTTAASDDASSTDSGDAGANSGGRRRRRVSGRDGTERRRREGRSAPSSPYASGSVWQVADTGAGRVRSSASPSARVLSALRRLGPWVLVHVLFLSLAAGTGWYVYSVVLPPAERSAALLFVLIGEVGLAVVLSSLHILSRLYR